MKIEGVIKRVRKRRVFYDDDVFEELEKQVIEDLEEELNETDEKIKSQLNSINSDKLDEEVVFNVIFSKIYNTLKQLLIQ